MSGAWLWFSGVKLYLNIGTSVAAFPAVSGKAGKAAGGNGLSFGYSTENQRNKDTGPIPSGVYMIRTGDIIQYRATNSTYVKAALSAVFGDHSATEYLRRMEGAWGKIPGASGYIIPILTTEGSTEYAFGRNRCWIHGSDFPGSIGCIDLTDNMDSFVTALKATKAGSVPLKVQYGVGPEGLEPREIDIRGRNISNVA